MPLKLALAPGAKLATVKTGVAPVRSLVTTRLVKMVSPALRTLPLKVSKLPDLTASSGQSWVTVRREEVKIAQVVVVEIDTVVPPHWSKPVAVKVSVMAQRLAGMV